MVFIGREDELRKLELYYATEAIRTCAIVGRRRVGKTTLIDTFCEGKPSIRFDLITGEDSGDVRKRVHDFNDLIGFLGSLEPEERTVVAIDELPDAIELFDDVPSKLMRYVDGRLKRQNIFLIICGSSVSAMLRELNDGGRPLFQRFPIQMMLRSLSYAEASRFHKGLSEADRVRAYAICSGVPLYHELFSAFGSVDEAISELFLDRKGS